MSAARPGWTLSGFEALKAEVDLLRAVESAHGLREFGACGQASGVDAADGRAQAALPTQKLVGEFNHARVWRRLRSDPHEPIDEGFLFLLRKSPRQYHRHGGRGARDARVAMDKQMAKIVACVAAEGEDRLDVRPLRQYDVGSGLDWVVKATAKRPCRFSARCRMTHCTSSQGARRWTAKRRKTNE
jgi:hypothetical protein